MTVIDDDRLARLLGEAASSFDVPADGRASIIARAGGATADVPGEPGAGPDPADGDDGPVAPPAARRPAEACRRRGTPEPAHRGGGVRRRAAGRAGRRRRVDTARLPARPRPRAWRTGPPRRCVPGRTRPTTAPTAQNPASQFKTYGPNASANSARGQAPLTQSQVKSGTTAAGGLSSTALPRDAVGQSSRIEQSGTLGLAVGRGAVNRTVASLTALADANHGFVANSQTQTGAGGAPYGSVTLEVPVDNFAAVLKEAEALGRTSGAVDPGHRRHRPVRRPAGAHRRPGAQRPAVPDHHGEGYDRRRRAVGAGADRHHSVAD